MALDLRRPWQAAPRTAQRAAPATGPAPFSRTRDADGRARGRWLIAVAAIVVQIALGASQVWSVFRDPLVQLSGWTVAEVTFAYSANLFVSGIASCLGGIWMRQIGPRRLAASAGLLFGLGLGLASLAEGRLWLLYLAYGLVAGVGRGAAAVVAPSTLVRWFPEKRGLMAGLAGAGVGIGALLIAPLAGLLVEAAGVLATFPVLGFATLAAIVAVATQLRNPPEGFRPGGWSPPPEQARGRSLSLRRALRTRALYNLWALMLLNAVAGIAVISQAAPLAQELTGAGLYEAAGLVGVIGVAAAVGQVCGGWLSDLAGRRQVFVALLLIQAGALALMPAATSYAAFLVLAALLLACLGGGLGTMPALAADYFGTRDLSAIVGFLFTAMGVGAVVGPLAIALTRQWTGEYGLALNSFAALALVSTVLPLALRPPVAATRRTIRLVSPRAPRAA